MLGDRVTLYNFFKAQLWTGDLKSNYVFTLRILHFTNIILLNSRLYGSFELINTETLNCISIKFV